MFQVKFSISKGGGNIKTVDKVFSSESEYNSFVQYYQKNHRHGKIIGETEPINLESVDFKVNDFMTINNFERLKIFKDFRKFGKMYTYESFTGQVDGKGVIGYICLADDNIYDIKYLE